MKNLLPLAILACASATAQAADSSQIYFEKGVAELQAKRYLVATTNFNKAISFNPQNVQALIQNGFTYIHMGKLDDGKAALEKALALEPQNQSIIKELAPLYLAYRQFDKAINLAQQCRSCEGNERILGICYYQKAEYSNAAQHLQLAIKENPKDAEATYKLGQTYVEMEEYQQAIDVYKNAVKLEGAKPTWFYELGLLQYNLEDYKAALASFRAAADKGYVATRDFKENLGYACLYSGEYDYGETVLLSLLVDQPGNKEILRDIAGIFYKNKLYDRALGYCQKLLEINEKDAKALYQAGLCFQKKGEKDRGSKMCDKAIELDPSLESLRKKKEIVGL